MKVKTLFHSFILALTLFVSVPDAYSSLLSIDRPQLMDERGNPVVNATIYIGEGNRDPEIFPQQAYADQDRTSSLGSQLTTDDKGRLPKAYIEPPYSYRIRLEDGTQFDEQLFSFGIVEIDYTPGGTGTEAINVGAAAISDGSISQEQLDASVQSLLSNIGINSANISQEITDRANALAAEAAARTAEIQAGDTAIQASVDSLSTSVTANADGLTAQNTRVSAVESNLLDVYGDGSNIGLIAFATDFQSTQSAVDNATTGLSATRDLVIATETRLDDVAGDASGLTIEQLAANVEVLENSQPSGGGATIQSVQDVNVRVDGVEGRLDDTAGDGSNVTIESMASNLITVQADVTTAQNTADAAVSSVAAATARLDSVDGAGQTVEALATQVDTVEATANGLNATVTSNSTAISNLENGVAAQWEVQASAAGVTGSVGLYNDNGTTKFLIKADQVEADRGNGPESLFDADGLLSSEFQRVYYTAPASPYIIPDIPNTYVGDFTNYDVSSLTTILTQGTYEFEFVMPGIVFHSDPATSSSLSPNLGLKLGTASDAASIVAGTLTSFHQISIGEVDEERYTDMSPAGAGFNGAALHDDYTNFLILTPITPAGHTSQYKTVHKGIITVTSASATITPYIRIPPESGIGVNTVPSISFKIINLIQ